MIAKPDRPIGLSSAMQATLLLLGQGYAYDFGCHGPLAYHCRMRTLDALHRRGLIANLGELTEAGQALVEATTVEQGNPQEASRPYLPA